MKSWNDFSNEMPDLAEIGRKLLFQTREHVGLAFIATLRKDGAPRLHPVSLVFSRGHLYVMIPPASPKCADLLRDGRFAMQAYPRLQVDENEEFYISGRADQIQDPTIRRMLIEDTQIISAEDEVLFELFLERAMHTKLVNLGMPDEHPVHKKWRAF
jgi:hypothetical protein